MSEIAPCSRETYEARMFASAASLFAHHVATVDANHIRLTSPSVPDILSCVIVGMGGDTVVVSGSLQSVGFRLPPDARTALDDHSVLRCPLNSFMFPLTPMSRYVDAARRFFDMTPADEERCESFLEERRSEVALHDIDTALARLDAQALVANPGLAPGDAGADALLALLAELGSPTLSDAFRAVGIGGILPTLGRVASRRVINGVAMLHRAYAVVSAGRTTGP